MSEEPADEESSQPLPEYEISQYFPHKGRANDLPAEEYRKLKDEYGYVRAWAKSRPDRFRELQRMLNQARMGTTFDVYIADSVRYAAIATVGGILVGVLVAWLLALAGLFTGLQSPISVDGQLVEFVRQNKAFLAGGILAVGLGLGTGAVTLIGRYYYPKYLVNKRRQNINFLLPHAIVYMYALSYGGMNLVEVVDNLADSEDAYGEVSREFDSVRRDVEVFGNDLTTALQNARNLTSSANLERFLDDLVSVLDTGGDVTTYLEDSTDTYLEQAKDEQEEFLGTLSVFSEIYIAGFVAAPLFLIVIMMVISFLGGGNISQMYLFIYVGFPLGMAAFLGLIVALSSAYTYPKTRLEIDEWMDETTVTAADIAADERFQQYEKSKRWGRLKRTLETPSELVSKRPLLTLVVTVPLAAALVAVFVLTGVASPATMMEDPIQTTSGLFVYPFLVVTVPLALFHELKRGRENTIVSRMPGSLNILASANKMGIQFTDSLELLAQYSSGTLANEFRITRNDLLWSGNLNRSLLAFGNRIDIPQISRTVKIIADGVRSSGDLARILSIAAQDTRDRHRLLRTRRREMSSYIAVVVIGFLVYLMVIVFLDTGYLQPIEEIAAGSSPTEQGAPVSLTHVRTDIYRMLFYHSVLIQAIGTGVIAGKLADDDVLSGLKYSIALVALTVITFSFIQP